MSKKVWAFEIEGERHVVDLGYSWFTLSGKVTVDGKFLTGWGWALTSREIPFEVGGKKAVLRFIINPLSPNKQELYVDGALVEPSR
jgi:hypothetical protein